MSIYQSDSYTFSLCLTRPDTTNIEITSVTNNAGQATYVYTLVSGPPLHLSTKIVITGMSTSGNNGTFTITDLGLQFDSLGDLVGGTFTVTNSGSVTATQDGDGVVGTTPNVTTPPVLQIIRLSDFTAILGSPAAMTALDGTNQVYAYTWGIGAAASGEYLAIISYAADGNIFSGKALEKIRIGDTRIIGTVALDSTVAKDATVSKDATVAKSTDLAAINPNTSAVVLAIKTKTDNLPVDPAGMTLLGDTVINVGDIHDAVLGNENVDKTQNPPIYTKKRLNNSVLAQYTLGDDNTQTSKTKF